MLRGFFAWLEQRTYNAVFSGCKRAVDDLSNGEVVIEADAPMLNDECPSRTGDALPARNSSRSRSSAKKRTKRSVAK